MKTAALYDIHGNLSALEAVLKEIDQIEVDQIVIGGDIVPGPMPVECIERILEKNIPVHFIRGNCETAVLNILQNKNTGNFSESILENLYWTAKQLHPEHVKLFSGLNLTFETRTEKSDNVLFCHATPRDENEIFTRLTSEEKLLPVFDNVDADIVVCGHTHMQFDITVGNVRIVNSGSVGMPYGKPGAYWLLLGQNVEFRFTPYNLSMAAEIIQKTDYPGAKEFAENILHPQSEGSVLEILKRAELK